MPIQYDEKNIAFQLDTLHTTMLFRVLEDGHLLSEYWGRRMRKADLTRLWQTCPTGFSPQYKGVPDDRYALDLIPTEYPVFGGGDFRSPALQVEFPDGSRLLDLRYYSHRILHTDDGVDGLPCIDGADDVLEVTLTDEPTGLKVINRYALFFAADCIARSAIIINETGRKLRIQRALSASIDLPDDRFEMIGLYGAHVRERHIDRTPLRHGCQTIESRRGASSHQQNPFAALVAPETTEHAGEAYGAVLIYSGNFLICAEVDQYHSTRLQLGIHDFDFRWTLESGEQFVTPQAVLTYTDAGLNRMSQNFHDVFRQHLGHSDWRGRVRPIVINNWEATYFQFDEEKLLTIIDSCDGLGIDIFVLDDGWFGHRDDDTTSLGDWFLDRRKLPNGLRPLIERCESLGMRFGLWFEPEMISEDSELYRAHPDWCIRKDGRPYCLGRHQLILDLSREEVLEYLKTAIGSILTENRISYVKWDMNRHMTDAYSAALPPDRQPEITHRYMLNLYRLLAYLTTSFPDVLFEGCSGGGGRFDAGMLYFMPQTWTSDDSDAIERLKIQYGTSLAYPPVTMTAHVSACPNHQVGRMTPFQTRALVAMSATFGYELNPLSLSDEERSQIVQQTAMYRQIAPMIVDGRFYRLISPFESDACAWMFVAPGQERAFVVYVQQQTTPSMPNRRLKLTGLNPDFRYHIHELDADFNGDELMYAGISIPFLRDYEAMRYTLDKVSV